VNGSSGFGHAASKSARSDEISPGVNSLLETALTTADVVILIRPRLDRFADLRIRVIEHAHAASLPTTTGRA
jgi:hypothetical protein